MSRSLCLPDRPTRHAQWVWQRRRAQWGYWASRMGVALVLAGAVLLALVLIREGGSHPRPWAQVKTDTAKAAWLMVPVLGLLWDAVLGHLWHDPEAWWAPVPEEDYPGLEALALGAAQGEIWRTWRTSEVPILQRDRLDLEARRARWH